MIPGEVEGDYRISPNIKRLTTLTSEGPNLPAGLASLAASLLQAEPRGPITWSLSQSYNGIFTKSIK